MRINGIEKFPQAYKALAGVQHVVDESSLDHKLLELVKMRASQINGCAYCLDMHSKDAIAIGESTQRLFALPAWRETPFFSSRERAALAWCESLTLISETGAPDDVFEALKAEFSETEIMELSLAIVVINSWNRLAISQRQDVGGYVSHRKPS